ncbi:hypothetical protein CIG37_18520 [Serratia marcescens]|nr:hypothetical protein [Serratia marcescens]OZP47350.1 hypothetical protein CIG46_14945 [Serratia marcescens]OZP51670.1 hypothetical protein CIG37_18520 [Serratia marcescens]OZP58269.1 hypothetical protein CIG56_10055 [Serratia marcescens]HAU5714546.1 hypothetical protein [Serratia marcescens]
MSQYLLGVSKASVLNDNSARMLRREEKACQHVRRDNCATNHHGVQWQKWRLNRTEKVAAIAYRHQECC